MAIVTQLAKDPVPHSGDNAFFMRKLGLMIAPTGGASEESKYNAYLK